MENLEKSEDTSLEEENEIKSLNKISMENIPKSSEESRSQIFFEEKKHEKNDVEILEDFPKRTISYKTNSLKREKSTPLLLSSPNSPQLPHQNLTASKNKENQKINTGSSIREITQNKQSSANKDMFLQIDCVKIFKSYFPKSNVNLIIEQCNKMKRKKIKANETDALLSKYTFFTEKMKLMMKPENKKNGIIKEEKNKKTKSLKSHLSAHPTLFSVFSKAKQYKK